MKLPRLDTPNGGALELTGFVELVETDGVPPPDTVAVLVSGPSTPEPTVA